ncbi:Xaa-Pro peptidase family protein [uncultured Mitsuokella sp.]|uniref:M24 family metallopeptidase n=1 Tax=uncultured Mitsuokella sp. TaxID=453120 RepID=UPI0026DC8909|nr:Xaa-Pro peptidase family protein [uncultured Mitsuokella sp.]
MNPNRLEALRALLARESLDAVVVTKYVNLHYFSGFRGDDTTLVVTQDHALLITDNRYTEQAQKQAPLYEIVEQKGGLLKKTAECLEKLGCQKVGFEGNAMLYNDHVALAAMLPGVDFSKALTLDALRAVKDAEEIGCIRRACEIADKAFSDIVTFIRPGRTEIEVAARLEQVMRAAGSEKPSFDTIVASGLRGSMPHGTATEKVIEEGDFVTMDYGAKFQGYCSDITRTVCVGHATPRQREVYEAVLGTQELVLSLIGPHKSCLAIDTASREYLARYDLAKYFGHGLGHSLGLEIHESPRLSRSCAPEDVLVPGNLITDEPGVYLPGWGGLRIEDTVLVTETGCERLTKSDKSLLELGC